MAIHYSITQIIIIKVIILLSFSNYKEGEGLLAGRREKGLGLRDGVMEEWM